MHPIDPSTRLSILVPLLISPFVGSFLAVLARRIPRGESVVAPRSHCETCGRPLRAAALVPVLSFLVLRGRAACCGAPIASSHLMIELLAILIPATVLALFPDVSPAVAFAGSLLGWWLLALAAIDLACWRLPDALTLPLLFAGLAVSWGLDGADGDPQAVLLDRLLATVLGFSSLALLASLYRRVRGREGIGMGDAKLLAAGGAWCGLAALPTVVLIGAGTGIVFGLARHGRHAAGGSAIPFGPTLALGIWATWLLGH